MNIRKENIVGVIGKNGSGKTSVLNIIMQNVLPTHGDLLFNGIRADSHNYFSLREQFEYIGANRNLYYLSIHDNIALSGDELLTKSSY